MSSVIFRLAILLMLGRGSTFSQKPTPRFIEASVKSVSPEQYHGGPLYPQVTEGRIRCLCSLPTLISFATGLRREEITVSTRGIKEADVYQLTATFPEPQRGHLQEMVYALLEERFAFSAHKESRLTPVYAMLVDKQGLKLKPATRPPVSRPESIDKPTRSVVKFVISGSLDRLTFEASGTLDDLARLVRLDRPVINLTEVSGRFDFAIDAIVPPKAGPPLILRDGTVIRSNIAESGLDGPGSIFTEIRKLGLILEPRKVTAMHLIVDRVDRTPTSN